MFAAASCDRNAVPNPAIVVNDIIVRGDKAFAKHFAMLGLIRDKAELWPESSDGPNEVAVDYAVAVLNRLQNDSLNPDRLIASTEGGIAICFVRSNKYADIECLNSGVILGVTSNKRDRPTVWEITPGPGDIARACSRLRMFLSGQSAQTNDSRKPWYRFGFSPSP
jgi:hypothetical protein